MPSNRTNRLGREKSPYLLQHAHNPVDWYPWGDEAFERARREDKPLFLSIGYSTCHWCHVMERESFDDEEAARLLNETFVCVKVDREERPDLDQYYMAVCQALTGSGGWPLTIVMTPDRKPFFAGTYFPKTRRWGRPGIMELVPSVGRFWKERREEVLVSADQITAAMTGGRAPKEQEPAREEDLNREPGPRYDIRQASQREAGLEHTGLGPAILGEAIAELEGDFDPRNGGFGSAPKFPSPHNLTLLLRYWKRTGRAEALAMVEATLRGMRNGGIYDHLGYGFHRYSTDAGWLVPHFEKMLYDQALLARAYVDAFLATGKEEYRRTAFETLDYVLRDMTAPEGGFYSAEDADSEGEEGRFYLWTAEEIREALGERDAPVALDAFGVRPEGNFAEPGSGGPDGRNILRLAGTAGASSRARGGRPRQAAAGPARRSCESSSAPTRNSPRPEKILDDVGENLLRIRDRLFRAREKRAHPFKDTKVLADWNGLVIGALAAAGRVADNTRFVRAAERAAWFILDGMRDRKDHLFHAYSDGEARIPAFLDDHAFLIDGLIELYESTFDPGHLEKALALADEAISLFWDDERGGFHFVRPGSELPHRGKEIYDGAIPSGNSAMLMNLLRLARMTGRAGLEEKAAKMSEAFAEGVRAHPRAHTVFLSALDFAAGPSSEVVIVGRPGDGSTNALLEALAGTYLPNAVVLFKPEEEDASKILPIGRGAAKPKRPAESGGSSESVGKPKAASIETPDRAARIGKLAPFTKGMRPIGDRAAAYVCTGGRCLKPVTSVEQLLRALR